MPPSDSPKSPKPCEAGTGSTTAFPSNSKVPQAEILSATRHIFLCPGPDCCPLEKGEALWNLLKEECRSLPVRVLRTQAACLRICTGGPWLVIYPEGIWYGEMDSEKLRRILREHVRDGRPVAEYIATTMPNLCRSHPEPAGKPEGSAHP